MPTRYSVNLRDMPNIGIAAVRAGRCPEGHDLTAPEAVSRFSKGYRCSACWREARGPKLCKSGEHPLSPGQRRCNACAKTASEGPKDMSYLFVGLPPLEVIEGAVCGPATAHLFDMPDSEVRGAHAVAETAHRAMLICEGCPVRAACLADALEWRREGVWGGARFSKRWHQSNRSALRNGTPLPPLHTLAYVQARKLRHENLTDAGAFDTSDMSA